MAQPLREVPDQEFLRASQPKIGSIVDGERHNCPHCGISIFRPGEGKRPKRGEEKLFEANCGGCGRKIYYLYLDDRTGEDGRVVLYFRSDPFPGRSQKLGVGGTK